MELFVINRHGEETSEITEEQEKAKLEKVLQQIERKKQQRILQREKKQEKQELQIAESPVNDLENKQEEKNGITTERIDEVLDHTTITATKKENNEVPKSINVENFTILGAGTNFKKIKAERVLPQWLMNPTIISSNLHNLTTKVSKIKQLDKTIRRQLKTNNVKYLFPVQSEVIPWLLQTHEHKSMFPRDVCVSAPTGSGKTLAFVLPIVQLLKQYTVRKIRALVILPTQDLAEQVFRTFKMYTQGTHIEAGLITGKHLFEMEQKQLRYCSESFGYISKIDILVCTAGRLVSHMKMTPGFSLSSLKFLVIDEADRVLESVQDDWLYHLEKHISTESYTLQNRKILNLCSLQKQRSPQKLLFSATLTQDPEKIEKLSLFQPKLFSCVVQNVEMDSNPNTFMGKFTTPKELTEKYIVCSKDLKPLVLYRFIKREKLTKTIVFAHSLDTAHRLKLLLQSLFKDKLKIEEMSSSLKGKTRDSLIASFAKGEIDLLICTDFLARGIDLPGVECVVSYSAPKYLKTYIHRAGRTARAGESGLAVSLLSNEQLPAFKTLLNQMKKGIEEVKIEEEDLETLSKRYKKALNKLKEAVTKEEVSIKSRKKSLKNMKTKKRLPKIKS